MDLAGFRGRYWLYLYSIGVFLVILTFGTHAVFSRYYIKTVFGYEYNLVIILGGVELLSAIFSLFAGVLSDITGRRRMLLLGFIGPISYFMISILGIGYMIPLIFIAGIGESIVLTSSAGVVLDKGRSSGSYYAVYSAGMPIGWGLSGILFSILPINLDFVYKILSLIEFIAIIIFYLSYPGGDIRTIEIKDVINAFKLSKKALMLLALTIFLISSSIEMFWNGFYFKLIDIIGDDQLLFGLLYSTFPALLGFIGRFLAGRLVDKHSPWYILITLPFSVLLVSLGMYILNGPLIIIFWLVPIYAFYEVSTMISVSRVLPSESQSSGAGIVTLSRSLGGLMIFIIGLIYLFNLDMVMMVIGLLSMLAVAVIMKLHEVRNLF